MSDAGGIVVCTRSRSPTGTAIRTSAPVTDASAPPSPSSTVSPPLDPIATELARMRIGSRRRPITLKVALEGLQPVCDEAHYADRLTTFLRTHGRIAIFQDASD